MEKYILLKYKRVLFPYLSFVIFWCDANLPLTSPVTMGEICIFLFIPPIEQETRMLELAEVTSANQAIYAQNFQLEIR